MIGFGREKILLSASMGPNLPLRNATSATAR
jgi:hypothetical protein